MTPRKIPPSAAAVLVAIAGTFCAMPDAAQAALLGFYDFRSVVASQGGTSDPTPPPTFDHLSFGPVTANGLGATSRASGVWSFSGWRTDSQPTADRYYEIALSAEPGFVLDLDALQFGVRRSPTGPRNYSIRSNLDQYQSDLPAVISPPNPALSAQANHFVFVEDNSTTHTTSVTGSTIELTSAFDNLSLQLVVFRIYAFKAESAAGTFAIDDLGFYGSVHPVAADPPPNDPQDVPEASVSTWMLFSAAWGILVEVLRRKRARASR